MKKTFIQGIKLEYKKDMSLHKLDTMPSPNTVFVATSQHTGKHAKTIVKVGDKVIQGQKIAEADGLISANVFSPISGEVKSITKKRVYNGICDHIEIVKDSNSDKSFSFNALDLTASNDEIKNRIRDCGIVGQGGAGFPTDVKLSIGDNKIDTFLVNGAECEPYITCDSVIMSDYAEQTVKGALALAKVVDAKCVIFAIEDNKLDGIYSINEVLESPEIKSYLKSNNVCARVDVVKSKYPQGSEKQLIKAVTKRTVKLKEYPVSEGIVVNNITTCFSAYRAIFEGKPLYERLLTLTGKGIKNPGNYWVSVGTTYRDLIEFSGGESDTTKVVKILNGGPMMGFAVETRDYAITKLTSCILLLDETEAFTGAPMPCINCGRCARACPMRLMPMYIDSYTLAGDYKKAMKYGSPYCIECGCCTYVCPAKRPLVQSIRLAKKKNQEARESKG